MEMTIEDRMNAERLLGDPVELKRLLVRAECRAAINSGNKAGCEKRTDMDDVLDAFIALTRLRLFELQSSRNQRKDVA